MNTKNEKDKKDKGSNSQDDCCTPVNSQEDLNQSENFSRLVSQPSHSSYDAEDEDGYEDEYAVDHDEKNSSEESFSPSSNVSSDKNLDRVAGENQNPSYKGSDEKNIQDAARTTNVNTGKDLNKDKSKIKKQ